MADDPKLELLKLELELLKLEYEKAADRYQEIYRSIWTIFSYLSAVSGGVLAYGFDKVQISALVLIAPLPLFFWFTTTYLPLDRYGNKVLVRLAAMEGLALTRFGLPMCHFKQASQKTTSPILCALYSTWKERENRSEASLWRYFLKSACNQVLRARFWIWFWFLILLLVWTYHLQQFWHSDRSFRLKAEQLRPMTIELIQSAPLIEVNW